MLISPAYAQGLGGLGASLASYSQFLPIVLIFGVFYFLLIRPQQQQQKKLKARLAALRRGDKVVTGGGLVGVVQKVREGSNEVEIELAPNVRVVAVRETINTVIDPVAANDAKPPAAKS
jgi:preprotein translocase subunit YajC